MSKVSAVEALYAGVKELFPEAVAVSVGESMQTDDNGNPHGWWYAHAYRKPIKTPAALQDTIAFGCGVSPAEVLADMKVDAKRRADRDVRTMKESAG